MLNLQKVQLDWQCFYRAKKGAMLSRDSTNTNAAKMGQEEWYKILFPQGESSIRRV